MSDVSMPERELNTTRESTAELISRLAGFLPSQGPIAAFAFLNPLQAMEDVPFVDAMSRVKDLFGCEPFLSNHAYRSKLTEGRISLSDLRAVLTEDSVASGGTPGAGAFDRNELRLSMLQHCLNPGTENDLQWILAQSDELSRFHEATTHHHRERLIEATRHWVHQCTMKGIGSDRGSWSWLVQRTISDLGIATSATLDDPQWERLCLNLLWEVLRLRISEAKELPPPRCPVRHRDLLLDVSTEDSDQLVHEVLVPFCSAFLDQGYAQWSLPQREKGLFLCFLELMSQGGHFSRRWLQPVREEARRLLSENISALESLEESLEILGVEESEREDYLQKSLFSLRGFAGMIWQTETRPDRVFRGSEPGTLLEFMSVQLVLERFAIRWIASRSMQYEGDLSGLRPLLRKKFCDGHGRVTDEQRAYPIFQLAQLHGWSPQTLAEMPRAEFCEIVDEIESFPDFQRRKVFHLAFERQLQNRVLDAVSERASQPLRFPAAPKLQVVTCIDAREESYRRYLEEVEPNVETFSHAGFFCVPMYYRGAADAQFATLCPVVMKPQHWIVEEVVHSMADSDRQRAIARRWLGTATQGFNQGSRGSMTGALLTGLLGPVFTAPLVGRILFPRLTAKIHRTTRGLVAPPPITRLQLERAEGIPSGPTGEGIGFTLSEMVDMGEKVLRDMGLTSRFAPLVAILGHGSNCLNNPHESAYHCGACSGGIGSPNARALAAILNDRRVRVSLSDRGLVIPDATHFLGGRHNTATEEVTFYDLELLPTTHIRPFKDALDVFAKVASRNAHERSRRFETAALDMTPEQALRHVEDRAEDLSQTRPEYGNCTNAVCFVGRRSRIRGLYLDRRSFLMSYDEHQDTPDNQLLARILGPVIPVCEAINLLYTFSAMDNLGWGSGTKLPHNVTSLLGVMNGAASDLRTGLPWQGCDIHEPVRMLFIVEASAEAVLRVMKGNAWVDRIIRNEWAHLAILDYQTNRIRRFIGGEFVDYIPSPRPVPVTKSSLEWYRGRRGHLPFAILEEN